MSRNKIVHIILKSFLPLMGAAMVLWCAPVYGQTNNTVALPNLPNPLVSAAGKAVKNKKEWERKRRPEILKQFEEHIYGRIPGKPSGLKFRLLETGIALDGLAIRKQVKLSFSEKDSSAAMILLLYLPRTNKPVPVFIGLNFLGNSSIGEDPAILPSVAPLIRHGELVTVNPGEQAHRWPIREIIESGFGVATAYYQELEPDIVGGWQKAVRGKLSEELHIRPDEWAAIGVWAWGLSRIQDYLESDRDVDAHKTIVTGHSRLGKSALWAGAQDKRFAVVISNNSGEGGAALSRRNSGESIADLNNKFPYWFIEAYKKYNGQPEQLPVDQHMLLSLIAPRPLYVASASLDYWADPQGEFLALKHAEPVYGLYGLKGIPDVVVPAVNNPVGTDYLHYHIRQGKHEILLFDWLCYIRFAKNYFNR